MEIRGAAARASRALLAALMVVTLLAGCQRMVGGVGSPGPDQYPGTREMPLEWSKTVSSQEFQRVPATLVVRQGTVVDRDAFLQRFRDSRLKDDLAKAIDAAPGDALIYAGFLDDNCSPSLSPRVRFDGGAVSIFTDYSGDQGECAVHYKSYAVVAVDPALIPSTAPTTG